MVLPRPLDAYQGDPGEPVQAANPPLAVESPEWWRRRLLERLVRRATVCAEFADFYDGRQPLAFASEKFVAQFGRRFGRFPANFMPMVVDAERERLIVEGFRFGGATGDPTDEAVWRVWQDNQMDAESQIAHEIALSKGVSYIAVDPNQGEPTITVEDPSEVIVEHAAGSRRVRRAALKVYIDDDGYAQCYLYLPDAIHHWRSRNRRVDRLMGGLPQVAWDQHETLDNKLGAVPIVALVNRPRRDGTPRSEIEPVMGNQLAINFLRYSALIGSDGSALPQRWAKNLDVEVDEDTGKPVNPFTPGQTIWVQRRPTADESAQYGDNVPEAAFGQFPEASLQPFVTLIRSEVAQLASNSRTPYHYLLAEPTSVPPSGESIKSAEAPLVLKCEAAQVHFGEGWEEVMRLCLVVKGQRRKAAGSTEAETRWRDAETRNESAHTDAVLKVYAAGLLPDEFALEQLGYSPQQIKRIGEMEPSSARRKAEAAADTAENPPAPVIAPGGGGPPQGKPKQPTKGA